VKKPALHLARTRFINSGVIHFFPLQQHDDSHQAPCARDNAIRQLLLCVQGIAVEIGAAQGPGRVGFFFFFALDAGSIDLDFFFSTSILLMRLLMNLTDPARMIKSSRRYPHGRRQLTGDHLGNAYVL
jgi:hypothetical protein